MVNTLVVILFSAIGGMFLSTAKTSSHPSVSPGQNELGTTIELQRRLDEMEEKIVILQRDNKGLTVLVVKMQTELRGLQQLFQVKENLTRTQVTPDTAARQQADEAILQKITILNQKVDERLLCLQNTENVMKNTSNLCNASHISKLEESLQNLDKTTKARLKSIRDEVEQKCSLHDAKASEIQKTLQNHTSEIGALKKQLFDIQNFCEDEPPSPLNGKAVVFSRWYGSSVRYECNENFVLIKNSTVNCVSGKWKGHPPTCSYLDTTFYAEAAFNSTWTVDCYSEYNGNKIKFSRAVDTGTGGGIDKNAEFRTSSKSAKMTLAKVNWLNYYGAYRCGFTTEEGSSNIIVPLQRAGALHFSNLSLVATVQDPVSLRLSSSEPAPRILWSRDGRRVESWDGMKDVMIESATEEDTGIYHARHEGESDKAILRLVVRRCKSNLYGQECDLKCPPCYNGGICHDLFGVCICPVGFVGKNCEKPCKEGFHGADCARPCALADCKFRFFCKIDPFGCTCARGFKGRWCDEDCEPGLYGADCKQQCHCVEGSQPCNRFTGSCPGGCAPGWTGESCGINDANE